MIQEGFLVVFKSKLAQRFENTSNAKEVMTVGVEVAVLLFPIVSPGQFSYFREVMQLKWEPVSLSKTQP